MLRGNRLVYTTIEEEIEFEDYGVFTNDNTYLITLIHITKDQK